jgi:hypothetical protein
LRNGGVLCAGWIQPAGAFGGLALCLRGKFLLGRLRDKVALQPVVFFLENPVGLLHPALISFHRPNGINGVGEGVAKAAVAGVTGRAVEQSVAFGKALGRQLVRVEQVDDFV